MEKNYSKEWETENAGGDRKKVRTGIQNHSGQEGIGKMAFVLLEGGAFLTAEWGFFHPRPSAVNVFLNFPGLQRTLFHYGISFHQKDQ